MVCLNHVVALCSLCEALSVTTESVQGTTTNITSFSLTNRRLLTGEGIYISKLGRTL